MYCVFHHSWTKNAVSLLQTFATVLKQLKMMRSCHAMTRESELYICASSSKQYMSKAFSALNVTIVNRLLSTSFFHSLHFALRLAKYLLADTRVLCSNLCISAILLMLCMRAPAATNETQ
jgi:hypothetical protein